MKSRTHFTLIELLIVIAIIAILASMLLPTLNKVRETGRKALCLSNMKQLGLAMTFYTQDFNAFYPRAQCANYTTWARFFVRMARYLPGKTLMCPTSTMSQSLYYRSLWERDAQDQDMNSWLHSHYGINYGEFGNNADVPGTSKTKETEIRRPSKFVVAAEAAYGTGSYQPDPQPFMFVSNTYKWGWITLYPRHSGKKQSNVLFGDGHVASLTGKGGTPEAIAQSFFLDNGALRRYNVADNCWTWNGKARPYGIESRP